VGFDPRGRFHADIANQYEPVPEGTRSNAVLINGIWVNPRLPEPPTKEQIQAQQAAEQEEIKRQTAHSIRSERNAKLTETDWTQVDDTPLDNVAKSAWANYRQALRDVPDQAGFPFDVNWPSAPV
jgi:hypothetical protein